MERKTGGGEVKATRGLSFLYPKHLIYCVFETKGLSL